MVESPPTFFFLSFFFILFLAVNQQQLDLGTELKMQICYFFTKVYIWLVDLNFFFLCVREREREMGQVQSFSSPITYEYQG